MGEFSKRIMNAINEEQDIGQELNGKPKLDENLMRKKINSRGVTWNGKGGERRKVSPTRGHQETGNEDDKYDKDGRLQDLLSRSKAHWEGGQTLQFTMLHFKQQCKNNMIIFLKPYLIKSENT